MNSCIIVHNLSYLCIPCQDFRKNGHSRCLYLKHTVFIIQYTETSAFRIFIQNYMHFEIVGQYNISKIDKPLKHNLKKTVNKTRK